MMNLIRNIFHYYYFFGGINLTARKNLKGRNQLDMKVLEITNLGIGNQFFLFFWKMRKMLKSVRRKFEKNLEKKSFIHAI